MRKIRLWMVLGVALLSGLPPAQATDGFSIGAGANYRVGNYGTDVRTGIWSAAFAASYQTRRWTIAVTVPYLRVRGAGNVLPGTGPVDNSNPLGRGLGALLGGGSASPKGHATTRTSASGLGDVVASAGYTLVSSADRSFGLALTGKLKFATASVNQGLGTGRNDYGLSLDSYKTLGRWTPFGGIGWTDYGSSRTIRLKHAVSANAGLDYRIESRDNVGLSYNVRQPIVAGGAAQSELTAYWAHRFGDKLRLQGEALGGTTRGSPDWGLGTSLNYAF
jgi:hypothetical protein